VPEPELAPIVWLSLRVALVATLIAGCLALPLARWLARQPPPRGRFLVEGLVLLPLVLPPVVVGYGLLVLFGRRGPVGRLLESQLGLVLPFAWTGAALAAAVMAFPLAVRVMQQAFAAVDPKLEEAAAVLGAGRAARYRRVVLPLAWPGIAAGLLLAFARALGEFGATITFAGNVAGETQTLPLAIWTALQSADRESLAWRLTLVSILLALAATWIGERLVARSRDR
jgi:molybdate transport system permease protein